MRCTLRAVAHKATDKSYGGADHIFSTEGVAVLWHGYSDLESKSRWEVFARAFKFLGDTGHPILKRTFEGLIHLQSLYGYTSEFLGVAPLFGSNAFFPVRSLDVHQDKGELFGDRAEGRASPIAVVRAKAKFVMRFIAKRGGAAKRAGLYLRSTDCKRQL